MIQRLVFSIMQTITNGGDTKKYIFYLGSIFMVSCLFQTLLDYKTNKITDSLNSALLKRMTNTVYYKYENDIRGMEPQLLTTYFEKLNNCLLDITLNHKWRKLTLLLLPTIFILYSFYVNYKIGLISLVIIGIIYYLSFKMINTSNELGKLNELNKNKFLGLFSDYIYNLISIYNNNTREVEINNLENDNLRIQSESINFYYLFTGKKLFLMILTIVSLLLFIYLIIYKFPSIEVEQKQNLIIFIMILLLEMYQIMNIVVPTSEKINSFHNIADSLKCSVVNTTNQVQDVNNFDINIVDLSYETILNKFNLNIPYRQRVAIMGKIGCGKSTSVKLIMKLIKPSSGNIYIGGVNIDDININKYRSIVSYIPQHIFLFDRSIEENIFYGSILNDIEKENIIKKYNIISFFGDDLKRKVGNNGAKLSGGQRQLLYIIRNIIQPSRKVIILDEPSVSLDQNSKKYLLELLNSIEDKTLIIITHDDDILKIVNRIIFLDKGRITEDETI
jgi:ABC-type multidrug transport system fused ATPase/permease subunit